MNWESRIVCQWLDVYTPEDDVKGERESEGGFVFGNEQTEAVREAVGCGGDELGVEDSVPMADAYAPEDDVKGERERRNMTEDFTRWKMSGDGRRQRWSGGRLTEACDGTLIQRDDDHDCDGSDGNGGGVFQVGRYGVWRYSGIE